MQSQQIKNTSDSGVRFGWWCVLLHDFPEQEGTVWFSGKPEKGQRFLLPSSGYTQEWEVNSVNEVEMSFTAIKPANDKRDE